MRRIFAQSMSAKSGSNSPASIATTTTAMINNRIGFLLLTGPA
ncbi:MAG TPA: hypothetical protein VHB23_12160 [Devosiaceae bacterium]|jgi:hypothetical protein|nr:hypothetical protein [Devosiaceae bacterium]